MNVDPFDRVGRVRWLISLRWLACAGVFLVTSVATYVIKLIDNPLPLYSCGCFIFLYNLFFVFQVRRRAAGAKTTLFIFTQIVFDLVALTALLYFTHIAHNPFVFYFVFHMVIASLLLRGWRPYWLAGFASVLVGTTMTLQFFDVIPIHQINLPHLTVSATEHRHEHDATWLFILFTAFSSTLFLTVYLTRSVRGYVDRARDEIRQKERMLGVGQLVAGISHQINNPLDGVQNCLRKISTVVTGDPQAEKYVLLMTEALSRIEAVARRVQSFARPHGLKLCRLDVNHCIKETLRLIAGSHDSGTQVNTELGDIPAALGDTFTLQEIIFNLYKNALLAMPNGGVLITRTFALPGDDYADQARVCIEVCDTGSGIPLELTEKVFEPFYTSRKDNGGTGLGLGLCRMLISEMGGSINVHITPEPGTTFRVIMRTADGITEKKNHEYPCG